MVGGERRYTVAWSVVLTPAIFDQLFPVALLHCCGAVGGGESGAFGLPLRQQLQREVGSDTIKCIYEGGKKPSAPWKCAIEWRHSSGQPTRWIPSFKCCVPASSSIPL